MNTVKEKIFITGVAGFLGSHLADAFLVKGHEVIGCDSLIGGDLANVPKGVKFYHYDCTDLEKMKELMVGVGIVYHCAALAHEGLSVFSPHLISRNVTDASVAVMSAAANQKIRRFIFCSSMARYGDNIVPFTEDMAANPKDPYGVAKYSCELVLAILSRVHGFEYVIAIPHNIIGPRQKYDDPFRNVAAIMINLMLQGRQPIIYGDGEQKRCFSFIQDDVGVLEQLAFADNVVGQAINIGPDEEFVTINELARVLGELLNFDVKPIYVPDRPQEVRLAHCSANKARKLLGYKTEYTLRQGLQEMIDYIKKHGAKSFQYHLPLEIINDKTPLSWKDRLF
jgi:UDP-glucose 4-epimerase